MPARLHAALLALVLSPTVGFAGSIVNEFATEGLEMSVEGLAQFNALSTSISDSDNTPALPAYMGSAGGGPDRSGSSVAESVSVDAGPPDSGIGSARGTITTTFNFGDATSDDHFVIAFNGEASASSAFLEGTAGPEPAEAFVSLEAYLKFDISESAAADESGQVGTLVLNLVGELGEYESLSLLYGKSALDEALLVEGQALIPLLVGRTYDLYLYYDMFAPHGVDPPFDFTLTGQLLSVGDEPNTVPTAGTVVLLLSALPWLRRRMHG